MLSCDKALIASHLVAQIIPLLVKSDTIHFRIINRMGVNIRQLKGDYDKWFSQLISSTNL